MFLSTRLNRSSRRGSAVSCYGNAGAKGRRNHIWFGKGLCDDALRISKGLDATPAEKFTSHPVTGTGAL